MIVPDCRRDEYYNQKFLTGEKKEFIGGFDWAVEMALDNFFHNFMDQLEIDDSYLGHVLQEKVPEYMQEEYTMEFAFPEAEEERKVETYFDYIQMKILEWIEMERNELITSIIDGMDEKEYAEARAKANEVC